MSMNYTVDQFRSDLETIQRNNMRDIVVRMFAPYVGMELAPHHVERQSDEMLSNFLREYAKTCAADDEADE